MQFRSSDTFTASSDRFTRNEQKAVKTTAFDLQLNPATPEVRFHRLDRRKEKRFWAVWGNRVMRMILRKTGRGQLKRDSGGFAVSNRVPALSAERPARRNSGSERFVAHLVTMVFEKIKKPKETLGWTLDS